MKIDEIVNIASRIRTPLMLAGLIMMILYGLYGQILNLGIFAPVGEESTFWLLSKIIDNLFWLAVLAVLLGVASHISVAYLKHKMKLRQSTIELVEARIDENITSPPPQKPF